jgi:hypothetical protein
MDDAEHRIIRRQVPCMKECMIISSHGPSRLGSGHAHGAPSPAGVDIETETDADTETDTEQRDATPAVRRTCVSVCGYVSGVEQVGRGELQLRFWCRAALFSLSGDCGPASFGCVGAWIG